MVSLRFRHCLFIFLLLNFFEIVQQVYSIKGPTHINGSIGEDALFMWNTTDQKVILTASWGIRKGNIPDPQFISVNSYNGKVYINNDIGDTLKRRVGFIGNLTIGRAWFLLKNLTVNDTNEYIASISDDVSRVLPYYVRLNVTEKEKEKPKEGPSPTPNTTAAAPNNTICCTIVGPTRLQDLVGNDVIFKWNKTDGREIRSAVWGLGNGQMPDPQFINVNAKTGKTISPSLPKPYTGRVDFVGNLSQGHAWFVIKNLTRNDTAEYIARISDGDVSELQSYSVVLSVKDRPEKPTEGHSPTPDTTAAAPNITPTPKPNSSNILRHTKGYMTLMAIALVMWHY